MFKRILIANRGEIALRIIRSCVELGIKTVAVYSEADRDSLHIKYADEAVCIGPAPPNASYLNIPNIISAAEVTSAEAIHPGYGFLAEDPNFADMCEACGIKFIGPSSEIMRSMGDKAQAKQMLLRAEVPIIPGTEGKVEGLRRYKSTAAEIGYPIMIKASAGGGGRGIRIARDETELLKFLPTAQAEAEASFGDPSVYLEKYLEEAKHIEFQLLADHYGNVLHLGERNCSIQRRHQKLVEESPSLGISDELRTRIGEAAVRGAKAIGYTNAGTIEFLVDRDENFYFLEMNTRIQVEHPVTEMVTGIDLVKLQIGIAAGERLRYSQDDIELRGHSLECRINAEDWGDNFVPSTGEIKVFHPPGGPGVRVDTHLYTGYKISPFYDSLLAKLIVWDEDRKKCVAKMKRALREFEIEGVITTIPFHQAILNDSLFEEGEIDTGFLPRWEERRRG